MSTLAFSIPGEPVGKGRPRFGKGRTFTDTKTAGYEVKVGLLCNVAVHRAKWLDEKPTDAPYFKVKMRVRRTYQDKGPDLDNVVKAILDGMNGIAYRDDRLVRIIDARIVPVRDGDEPRVDVEVHRLCTNAEWWAE